MLYTFGRCRVDKIKHLIGVQGAFKWLLKGTHTSLSPVLSACKFHSSSKRERRPFQYAEVFRESIADPETFWGEQAEDIDWFKPYLRVLDNSNPPFTKW